MNNTEKKGTKDNVSAESKVPIPEQSSVTDARGALRQFHLITDHIIRTEYESMILIDPKNGQARRLSYEESSGTCSYSEPFDYWEMESAYITRSCYEQNPQEILRQLSLDTIRAMLQIQNSYFVHFYVSGPGQHLLHKKAAFFYTDNERNLICQLLQDTTQTFEDERNRYLELQKSLEETKAIANANNHVLQLFNRDMRTPIHSILGLVEIADNEVTHPDVIRDYLYKIKSAGSSMSEIIDDILILSRITQSYPVPHQELLSLDRRLELLQSSLRENLHFRGLTFQCDIQDDISNEIIADDHYLNTILQKLLSFAMNNTVRGGEIRLSVRELLQKKNRTLMEFTVSCQGIDIHPEQIKNLFRPTDYLMNELRNDLSSIDLSLVILKYYVAAMKGSIVAQTGAGTSTQITVSLNFSLPEQELLSPAAEKEFTIPDFRHYRALIVDDDPINLEVGTKLLNRTGIRTISCSNGTDALNAVKAAQGELDVILVDIRMPGMDGLEVARQVRQLPLPFVKRVPIIAMTVNDSREDLKKSLDAGINAHLIKPIDPADLYTVLRKYLSQQE